MKKVLLFSFLIIAFVLLYGCQVPYKPNFESQKRVEPLFSLPESASIISQNFIFTAHHESYYPGGSSMTVKAVYTIQNNGEDTEMQVFVPVFPSDMQSLTDLADNLKIKENDQLQTINWDFRFDLNTFEDYDNLTYHNFLNGLITEEQYPYDEIIYKYEFTCPKKGTSQELNISIPEGTHILSDYYYTHVDSISSYQDGLFVYNKDTVEIPQTKLLTTGRFYSIGNEVVFSGNFDYEFSSSLSTFSSLVEQYQYNDFEAKMAQYSLYRFYHSNDLSMRNYDIYDQTTKGEDIISVFSSEIFLSGNGETTEIEVSYPFLPGEYTDTDEKFVYTYYDFFFDSERYLEDTISVTINLENATEFYSSTYDLDENNNIIFDISKGNHLRITYQTIWLEYI